MCGSKIENRLWEDIILSHVCCVTSQFKLFHSGSGKRAGKNMGIGRSFLSHSHWPLKLWGGKIPRNPCPALPVSTPTRHSHTITSRAGRTQLGILQSCPYEARKFWWPKASLSQFYGYRPSHGSAPRLRECIVEAAWLGSSYWLFVQQ